MHDLNGILYKMEGFEPPPLFPLLMAYTIIHDPFRHGKIFDRNFDITFPVKHLLTKLISTVSSVGKIILKF